MSNEPQKPNDPATYFVPAHDGLKCFVCANSGPNFDGNPFEIIEGDPTPKIAYIPHPFAGQYFYKRPGLFWRILRWIEAQDRKFRGWS